MSIVPQLIVNSIIAGSIYAFIAIGFNLIFGVTRFFNLAHGSMAVIGGYTVFYFAKTLGWGIGFSILLGIVIAGLVGLVLYKLVFAPMRRRRASNMVLLVASLGAFTLIQALIAILFTSQFKTLSDIGIQKIFSIGTGFFTATHLLMFAAVILITIILALILKFTSFGKAIKAISDDEEVAKIVGINTRRIISWVFLIGSAIAGLGGILIGFDTGLEPIMGLQLLLKGVIAAIIGGVGSIYGAVLGAFLLGFVENFGIWQISGEWKDAIAFGLLIIFLIFRPRGILGRK